MREEGRRTEQKPVASLAATHTFILSSYLPFHNNDFEAKLVHVSNFYPFLFSWLFVSKKFLVDGRYCYNIFGVLIISTPTSKTTATTTRDR